MITETLIHHCTKCDSPNIRKNGLDRRCRTPRQKYHCLDCNAYGTLNPKGYHDEATKEQALAIYQEQASIRGTARVMGIHQDTVSRWIKKVTLPSQPKI